MSKKIEKTIIEEAERILEATGIDLKLYPVLQGNIIVWLKQYLQIRLMIKYLLEQDDGINQFTDDFRKQINLGKYGLWEEDVHWQLKIRDFIENLQSKHHLEYIVLQDKEEKEELKMSTGLFKIICLCYLAQQRQMDTIREAADDLKKYPYRINENMVKQMNGRYSEIIYDYDQKIEEIFKEQPQYKELAWFIFDDVIDIQYMDEMIYRIKNWDNATVIKSIGKSKECFTKPFCRRIISLNRFNVSAEIVVEFLANKKMLGLPCCATCFQKVYEEVDYIVANKIKVDKEPKFDIQYSRDKNRKLREWISKWVYSWTDAKGEPKKILNEFDILTNPAKQLKKRLTKKEDSFPREITLGEMENCRIFDRHKKLRKKVKNFIKNENNLGNKEYRLIFEKWEPTNREKKDKKKDEYMAVILIFLKDKGIVRFSSKTIAKYNDEDKSEKEECPEYDEKKVHQVVISSNIINEWQSVNTKGEWDPIDFKGTLFTDKTL